MRRKPDIAEREREKRRAGMNDKRSWKDTCTCFFWVPWVSAASCGLARGDGGVLKREWYQGPRPNSQASVADGNTNHCHCHTKPSRRLGDRRCLSVKPGMKVSRHCRVLSCLVLSCPTCLSQANGPGTRRIAALACLPLATQAIPALADESFVCRMSHAGQRPRQ